MYKTKKILDRKIQAFKDRNTYKFANMIFFLYFLYEKY